MKLKRTKDWNPTLWAAAVFVSTFCFHTFAFAPYDIAELAYLLPVPILLWLFYQHPSPRIFLAAAGGAFWLSWLVLIFWLRHVTWLGWFGLASVVSLFPAAWAMLVYGWVPRFKDRGFPVRLLGILSVCSAWVILEFIRTFFLTGFPWLPLAASQWKRPVMLQVSSHTGFYGVSFVLLLVGVTIAFYIRHLLQGRKRGWQRFCPEFLLGIAVWLFVTFGIFQFNFVPGQRIPLFDSALVQPYIPQDVKWEPSQSSRIMSQIENLVIYQKHIGADIAVLPEAALPYPLIGDDAMRGWAEKLARDFGGPLLMGALAAEGPTILDDPWFNGFMLVYPEDGLDPVYYQKRRRVPFGEFIPFRQALFFLEKFVPIGGDIFPGKSASPLKLRNSGGETLIGPLICYEDIFPSLAADSVREGAQVLFVITNDAWYGEEGAAYQHAAHSVLRAVETRRPLVRVGNGGWSGWIDENGNIRSVLQSNTGSVYFRGSEVVEVSYIPHTLREQTFFVRYGNWFIWVCAAVVILFLLLLRRAPPDREEEEEWERVGRMKIDIPPRGRGAGGAK